MTPLVSRRVRLACTVLLVCWCAASWTISAQSDPEGYTGVHLHLNDKVEHFIEYGTGGLLAAGAFGSLTRPWLAAIVFCGLWGVGDEIHQSFVPGRDSSGMDVAADVTGASAGALALTWWAGRRQSGAAAADRDDKERRPA